MEKLDLSTYSKEIKSSYDAVVSGKNTYVVYTTLKDSSLKPTTLGDGDIKEFVSEFEEGSVQFGIIRVNPFGSDVQKIILLGWCPDSAPIKSKVSYATNFSNVGKILHYHVDITARDSDDLSIEDIMKTVSNASGARYSIQSLTPASSTASNFKPTPKPASPAPVNETHKPAPPIIKPKQLPPKKTIDSTDGWGDEEEIKERDFSKNPLETLPSAYKPTKVDINALRNSTLPEKATEEEDSHKSSTKTATISINPSGGLTSLPKPKPTNSVLSRYNQTSEVVKPEFGTKAPVFDSTPLKDSSKLVGGLNKNFGTEGGKTPAQIWAEKKGQYKEVPHELRPVNSQEVEEDVEHEDSVADVKSKFEQIQLQSEKEQNEVPVKHAASFKSSQAKETNPFPPPHQRETASFPPLPQKETTLFPPPPARDSFSKFQEKEVKPQENDNGWEDDAEQEDEEESKPTPAPAPVARSLPSRLTPSAPEPQPEQTPVVEPSTSKGNSAIAEYDYEKDEDNEIGFIEGEIIINIEFVDDDWWKGTNNNGDTGLFPASYVTLKENQNVSDTTTAPPSLPTRQSEEEEATIKQGPSATAEFDYDASEDNELTFKEGDIITDIDTVDEDWWLGTCNGERKLFPSNYVKLN